MKKYNKVILFKRIKILPSEYDYTLRIEYKGDFACGFEGQIYNDITTLDVHVKGEDVTIKNIVNHEPTVAPPSISFSGCTMHCDPGTIGTLNVVSGSGNVIPPTHSGDQWKFSLLLNHVSLATGSSHKLECPDADPVIANGEPYEAPQSLAFILKDSVQTSKTSNGEVGTFVTLTPK